MRQFMRDMLMLLIFVFMSWLSLMLFKPDALQSCLEVMK